jgi:isocitrate dehydrogenase (NAD+)
LLFIERAISSGVRGLRYDMESGTTVEAEEKRMGHPVTLIRGDGIGPAVTAAARFAIDATGAEIEWHEVEAGVGATGQASPSQAKSVLESIRKTKTALKGPMTASADGTARSTHAEIQKQLNLYASVMLAKSIPGVKSRFQDIDLVIVRENTEDLYAGIEFERTTREAADAREFLSRLSGTSIREDSALGIRQISVLGSQQIVEFAFRHAVVTGRKKVTAVHNANTLKFTDGLFLDVAREVAKDYPQIEFEDCSIDTLCLQLMQQPGLFDVLVLPNLYGNVVSALCAGMVGGTGVTPRAAVGCRGVAVFEAVYDTVEEETQTDANPIALILSGILMLQHLGEIEAAAKLQRAVNAVILDRSSANPKLILAKTTPVDTHEMAEAIAFAIAK